MEWVTRIGLVGDQDDSVAAHRAIPIAIELASRALNCEVRVRWLPTESIGTNDELVGLDGIWCVPASPYRSLDGALRAIRVAREQGIPFLGTCGGFQHAIVEFARNQLGWSTAGHAETEGGDSGPPVIAPLACSLVEVSGDVRFAPDSKIARAYGGLAAREGYHCRYGVNPRFADRLFADKLRVSAWDDAHDVRGVELAEHPFFVATLFQPERAALAGIFPKLPLAFIRAANCHARRNVLANDSGALRVGTSRGEYWLSDRRDLIDRIAVHEFLTGSYWAQNISREIVFRSLEHSLCFGVYDASGSLIGFGRVITDRATFGYLCDVFILESHRGIGLSHRLLELIGSHSALQGLRRFVLATRDAHELYRKHGFTPLATPERFMEISRSYVGQDQGEP